jgi:hypothetical protein
VLSHPATLYRSARLWTAYLGCAKSLGWAIQHGVDRLGPWWTGSLIEKHAFTKMNLSDVRMIMVIMHVLVKELLYQVLMGWILILKCLLSDARGRMWLCPFIPGIKYRCFLRTRLHGHLSGVGEPLAVAIRGPHVCRARA